jgi:hypothetical protein
LDAGTAQIARGPLIMIYLRGMHSVARSAA